MGASPGHPGFRCLGVTVLFGAILLAAFALARRRSDPLFPRASGAALGAAAGAWGAMMVDLWCPVLEPSHLVLGHALPIVLLTAAGALVVGPYVAMRGAPRLRRSGLTT
jgi:hypothetical protein